MTAAAASSPEAGGAESDPGVVKPVPREMEFTQADLAAGRELRVASAIAGRNGHYNAIVQHLSRIYQLYSACNQLYPGSYPLASCTWIVAAILHSKNTIESMLHPSQSDRSLKAVLTPAFCTQLAVQLQELEALLACVLQPLHPSTAARVFHLQVPGALRWEHWHFNFSQMMLEAVQSVHGISESIKQEHVLQLKAAASVCERHTATLVAQQRCLDAYFSSTPSTLREMSSSTLQQIELTTTSHAVSFQESFVPCVSRIAEWFDGSAFSAENAATSNLLIVQVPSAELSSVVTASFAHRVAAVHHLPSARSTDTSFQPLFLRNVVLDIVSQLLQSSFSEEPSYASLVLPLLAHVEDSATVRIELDQQNEVELWHLLVAQPLATLQSTHSSASTADRVASRKRQALVFAGIDEITPAELAAASILHPSLMLLLPSTQRDSVIGGANVAGSSHSPVRTWKPDRTAVRSAAPSGTANGIRNPYLTFLSKIMPTLPPWLGVILISTTGSTVPCKTSLNVAASMKQGREPQSDAASLGSQLRRFQPVIIDFSSASILHADELQTYVRTALRGQQKEISSDLVELIVEKTRACREGIKYADCLLQWIDQASRSADLNLHSAISSLPHTSLVDFYTHILTEFHEQMTSEKWSDIISDTFSVIQLLKCILTSLEPPSIPFLALVYNQHLSHGYSVQPGIAAKQMHEMLQLLSPLLSFQLGSDGSLLRVAPCSVHFQHWLLSSTSQQQNVTCGRRTRVPISREAVASREAARQPAAQVLTMDGSTFQLSDYFCDPIAMHAIWTQICWQTVQQQQRSIIPTHMPTDEDEFTTSSSFNLPSSITVAQPPAEGEPLFLRVEECYPNGPTREAVAPNEIMRYAICYGPAHAMQALAHHAASSSSEDSNASTNAEQVIETAFAFMTNLQYLHLRFMVDPWAHVHLLLEYAQLICICRAHHCRLPPPELCHLYSCCCTCDSIGYRRDREQQQYDRTWKHRCRRSL